MDAKIEMASTHNTCIITEAIRVMISYLFQCSILNKNQGGR